MPLALKTKEVQINKKEFLRGEGHLDLYQGDSFVHPYCVDSNRVDDLNQRPPDFKSSTLNIAVRAGVRGWLQPPPRYRNNVIFRAKRS